MDIFNGNMKVAELVDQNSRLLLVLSRLGISGSFGERTVSEACVRDGLDTETVLMICKVYSIPDFRPPHRDVRRCRVEDVIRYVHQSHNFYMKNAIESIADSIGRLIEPCLKSQQQVIWNFFTGYKQELLKHFAFEEEGVIPYINDLMKGHRNQNFNIHFFEENHSNIDEKLSDLKNIVMKSLPHECDDDMRISLLQSLYNLQEDLRSHTSIENNILVPMARLLEHANGHSSRHYDEVLEEDDNSELSEREKEILVCVAKGLINKKIADELNISVNTVITHRRNITRKLGIRSIPGLTVYAVLNNLIDINSIE